MAVLVRLDDNYQFKVFKYIINNFILFIYFKKLKGFICFLLKFIKIIVLLKSTLFDFSDFQKLNIYKNFIFTKLLFCLESIKI